MATAQGPKGADAHSPSRKFAQLGLWSAQGYQEGLEEGTEAAAGAAINLVGTPGAGRGGGGGGPITVHVTINAENGQAEEIGRVVEHLMAPALTRAFEQLALGGGMGAEPETA